VASKLLFFFARVLPIRVLAALALRGNGTMRMLSWLANELLASSPCTFASDFTLVAVPLPALLLLLGCDA
jgi:hypothetical protein